jgi:hypothetical protein
MSGIDLEEPESRGRRAAKEAIAAGCPRWCVVGADHDPDDVTTVDDSTGLPIQVIHVPPALEIRERRFVAAHNAEIRRAKLAGEIKIDLRPFLTTREALATLFRTGPTRQLAPKRAIELAGGDVRYEVYVPRPPKRPPRFRPPTGPYVRRLDEHGKHYVMSYDGSEILVVVGPDGEMVAFQSDGFWLVYHTRTGAQLHRFRRSPAR